MKRTIILGTALATIALPAFAQEKVVNVLSWGGAYTQAQVDAFAKPFEAKTGIKVQMRDADNPATPIKAEVESGNITTDLASVGFSDALRLCDEGLAVQIDQSKLLPGADGSDPADDFLENGLGDCFVATDVYSTIVAFDGSKFADGKPTEIADFFDLEKFPGKRGARKDSHFILEAALMADGVAPADVYDTLSTPEGIDRAFAKMDGIKDQMIWWEAGAQPIQLLADGEVAMTLAYNGRVFNAAIDEGKPFEILWDGQMYEMEGWIMPKGAPHPDAAMEFLVFSTSPEQLARAAEQISYGPPRKSSQSLVGNYKDTDTEMQPNLPTSDANMSNSLAVDVEFWVDHEAELNQRFNSWLAS